MNSRQRRKLEAERHNAELVERKERIKYEAENPRPRRISPALTMMLSMSEMHLLKARRK